MRTHMVVSLACLFVLVAESWGREPIKMRLPTESMRLEIRDSKLLVARGSGKAVSVSDDLEKVTNFAVTDWYGGEGLALAIEVEAIGESRSYWWMTMWVGGKEWPSEKDADKLGFGIKAKGRILENIEPLSILGLRGYGDGVLVTLCDRANLPDSDLKLAFRFQHDCAIFTTTRNLGISRRVYLKPIAVKAIADDWGQHVWLTEPSQASKPPVP